MFSFNVLYILAFSNLWVFGLVRKSVECTDRVDGVSNLI